MRQWHDDRERLTEPSPRLCFGYINVALWTVRWMELERIAHRV
jgi:hypothetical protein